MNCCSVIIDSQEEILHEKTCKEEFPHDCSFCERKGYFLPYRWGIRVCVPCQEVHDAEEVI